MSLLRMASTEYGYDIDPGEVAKIWRAGCIIRAALLGDIREAFRRDPDLVNLLLDDVVPRRHRSAAASTAGASSCRRPSGSASRCRRWRRRSPTTTRIAAQRLPANLTQAQRDFFGAHTYRRVDRDGVFHTEWTP